MTFRKVIPGQPMVNLSEMSEDLHCLVLMCKATLLAAHYEMERYVEPQKKESL